MIYDTRPEGFEPELEVVGCFVEHGDRIVLIKRQDHEPQGNKWALPAGKIKEKEETKEKAVIREVKEETNLELKTRDIEYLGKLYERYPDYDYVFHLYRAETSSRENLKINPEEHKDYRWVKPGEAIEMDLIRDLKWCIEKFYDI